MENRDAIIVLCSHLGKSELSKPLEPKEWQDFANVLLSNNLEPKDIFDFSEADFSNKLGLDKSQIERIIRLIERSAALSMEKTKYQNMGIEIITRADSGYPKKLKKALGQKCPPLFYCIGDLSLTNKKSVGFVGSRSVDDSDIDFTKGCLNKVLSNGYGIVSGGAKGIDFVSSEFALQNGAFAIEYVSDSLIRKLKNNQTVKSVQNGRLIILSETIPTSGFNIGTAMMRNKYIYAQSSGTVIIKTDYNKGGTWNGALENLRNNWCSEFCWDNNKYEGNIALILKGANPIDCDWDANVESPAKRPAEFKQLSLFDMNTTDG